MPPARRRSVMLAAAAAAAVPSPVANIVDDPGGYWVAPESPYRTLAELVAFARANPERVTYGTSGVGSDDHLAALAFERLAGGGGAHPPLAGGGPGGKAH